jgi:hypothetical protein
MNHTTIRIAMIITVIASTIMMMIAYLPTMVQKEQAYASSSMTTPQSTECPIDTVFEVALQRDLLTLPQGTILCMVGNQSPQTISAIPPPGSLLESLLHTVIISVFVLPETTGACPDGFQLAIIRSGIPAIPVSSGMCIQML